MPDTPATVSTPRGAQRPSMKGLARSAQVAAVAAVVAAVASVVSAGFSVSSWYAARRDDRVTAPASTPALPAGRVTDLAPWRALPPAAAVVLTRAEIDAAFRNLTTLAQEARIVPAFEAGQVVGYKLFSIDPGSLWERVGLKNGDVVLAIGDTLLVSADKALELLSTIKRSSHVRVDVRRRGGVPVRLDIEITD